MKPGIYHLIQDLPAPYPDKRVRHDWRNAPLRAGMLFAIREYDAEENIKIYDLSLLDGYSHQSIFLTKEAAQKIVQHLRPRESYSPEEYMQFKGCASEAMTILNQMREDGVFTMAQLKQYVDEL